MGRSKSILNRDAQWNEVSRLGRIYVSSEVIMYSIEDVVRITRWSKKVVQNLFNDFFTVSRKGSISKARTSQLCRLLLIGLNRRMPNGTYGGVRGATS